MLKALTVLALTNGVLADRIPIRKRELDVDMLEKQKSNLQYIFNDIDHEDDGNVGNDVGLKDYENSQYFIQVEVGTPA